MKALVVYAHPSAESYTAAIRDRVLAGLDKAGAEARVIDLYAEGFDPVLSPAEWGIYLDHPQNVAGVTAHVEAVGWADALIFIYPTWWYGLPAILKGWLDRVMAHEIAFTVGETGITPRLTQIKRLGVFTTCGASRALTWFIGQPGRRTLQRGIGLLCAKPLKTRYVAHYNMDQSTPETRAKHLTRVDRTLKRLIA